MGPNSNTSIPKRGGICPKTHGEGHQRRSQEERDWGVPCEEEEECGRASDFQRPPKARRAQRKIFFLSRKEHRSTSALTWNLYFIEPCQNECISVNPPSLWIIRLTN